MRSISCLLIFIFLAFPFQPASAKNVSKVAVIIHPEEVDSADDIEAAIIEATDHGTHPGTVILDGQNGAFIFTGADRSLNIFVSNLTLQGVNRAIIENCDDGLFFDDFPLQDIIIEGISFLCTGDGVEATGSFQDVTLRDNVFWAENNGIGVNGLSSGWLVTDNYIQSDWDAMNLTGAKGFTITNNLLSGYNGMVLLRDNQFQVRHNAIRATYQGIFLGQESWENMVQKNTVFGVNYAGISLEQGVVGNRILTNQVICATDTGCRTICATPDVVQGNKIAGNKP
ncbi:MAG TPA: NosD domain-containing protein [Anaerolineales bacterium]|nr:NosD domain-containing protein [Anaerolineales bacterium]